MKRKKISKKEKNFQEVFLDKIKQYNNLKRYYTHFVDLGDGKLMIIEWNGHWKYKIVELEGGK